MKVNLKTTVTPNLLEVFPLNVKILTVVEGGVGSLGAPQKMKLPSKFRYLMR